MPIEHLDVLIVGAGLSGIGAAYHLQSRLGDKRYAILESRTELGGTWSLFQYPGIRSDSDMYTFGYSFRPWTAEKSISDGASILKYLRETAAEYGIDRHIRYGQRVTAAAWSSTEASWLVDVEEGADKQRRQYRCRFLYLCCGYYDYEKGHAPAFPGQENFRGTIVHPQQWPRDHDHAGQRVVVIGSGATAVTLVPAMAGTAEHVTMLQRSPTYITSLPARDKIATWLRKRLPLLNFTSGYVRRSIDEFPQQGPRSPWRLRQNYLVDLLNLKFRPIADGTLRFSHVAQTTVGEPGKATA